MTPLQRTLTDVHLSDLMGFLGESMAVCEAVLLELKRRGQIRQDGPFSVPIDLPKGYPKPKYKHIFEPMAVV